MLPIYPPYVAGNEHYLNDIYTPYRNDNNTGRADMYFTSKARLVALLTSLVQCRRRGGDSSHLIPLNARLAAHPDGVADHKALVCGEFPVYQPIHETVSEGVQ